MQLTTIGLDVAKHIFQVHGADAQGRAVLRRRLDRWPALSLRPPRRAHGAAPTHTGKNTTAGLHREVIEGQGADESCFASATIPTLAAARMGTRNSFHT